MSAELNHRFRSGDTCPDSGWYVFDGYVDGTLEPLPSLGEMEVSLEAGETFPPIHGTRKECFWHRVEESDEAPEAMASAATGPAASPDSPALFNASAIS